MGWWANQSARHQSHKEGKSLRAVEGANRTHTYIDLDRSVVVKQKGRNEVVSVPLEGAKASLEEYSGELILTVEGAGGDGFMVPVERRDTLRAREFVRLVAAAASRASTAEAR